MLSSHGVCLGIRRDPIHQLLGCSWTTDDSIEDLKNNYLVNLTRSNRYATYPHKNWAQKGSFKIIGTRVIFVEDFHIDTGV